MADNKLPIYAVVDHKGIEFQVLIGIATVKNGTICFNKDDIHPAIVVPDGTLIDMDLKTCPTCTGQVRETVGLVCQTCGTDYGKN